jgi:hypothetical protein
MSSRRTRVLGNESFGPNHCVSLAVRARSCTLTGCTRASGITPSQRQRQRQRVSHEALAIPSYEVARVHVEVVGFGGGDATMRGRLSLHRRDEKFLAVAELRLRGLVWWCVLLAVLGHRTGWWAGWVGQRSRCCRFCRCGRCGRCGRGFMMRGGR